MIATGFVMLVAWPWAVGPKPSRGASHAVYRRYASRSTVYLTGLLVTFVGSGVGSYLLLKSVREEYADSMQQNLKVLIEGTLQDHGRKENDSHDA